MRRIRTVIIMLLLTALLTGCTEKNTSKENAEAEDLNIMKVENPQADEWYVKSIEAYNKQSAKEVMIYDVVNGEEMKDNAVTYLIDKDEKKVRMKEAESDEKSIDVTDESLCYGDIDLTYVTGYEVIGEEEMDGRNMIVVKMTEEGYLTAAEEAENEMGDQLKQLLEESAELQKAYDICLGEQMREVYVWFDAETKEPQWTEIDVTKDQMFKDMLEGIIAEVPEEELPTIRVMKCVSEETEELPGEPLVIETEENKK